jgi:hypothetical protein
MYDDISIDKGYAPDDDFEEIEQTMYDYISHDYSHVAEGDEYGVAIPGGTENMLATTNEDEDSQEDQLANIEDIQSAIIRRILNSINDHSELLKKAGPDGIMNAASDVASFHAPMEEIGSSDISIMVREVYREVGVDYPEEVNEDKEECKYCGGDCPNDEEHACDGYLGDIDDLYKVAEAKDKVTYDPKTGKLTGWEHEGDWKKSKGKKKDPVGKIHHMSDVARRRTEKLSKEETLEEAFEQALGEAAINVGDIIQKKGSPEIQGKVTGDGDGYYFINVNGEQYSIRMQDAEHVAKESIAGDDHVNKDVKMKRMGAKELGIADKFKIMPSQMQAMKKGDSENDLLHYNKLQAKNPMAEDEFNEAITQMRKIAGLE